MVKEQEIEELKVLLESLRRIIRKLNRLNKMNWEVSINIPYTGETITHTISDTKKQEIIQDAKDKRNALKTKIDSIDWNSLD